MFFLQYFLLSDFERDFAKSLSKSESKKYCKKNTESAIHHFYLSYLGNLINIDVINIQVDVYLILVGCLALPNANTGSDATSAPRHD